MGEIKLNWFNLKKNLCPKCNKDWAFDLEANGKGLLAHGCGFKISEKRYKEIVSNMTKDELEKLQPEEDPLTLY